MSFYSKGRRPLPKWRRSAQQQEADRRRTQGQIAESLRRRRRTGMLTRYETGVSASELMNGPKEDC